MRERGTLRSGLAMKRFRLQQGGTERGFVRLSSWAVSDTPLQATDKGRQSPRPLTPGSGLLHRRFVVPSLLQDFSRTAGTRHPWREPASSRHPCRSS
mgnify:CR=1 FL=1